MTYRGFASRPWLIVPICAAMHITYAIAYLFDPEVARITALHLVNVFFGKAVWLVMLLVAVMAMSVMFIRMPARHIHLCLWPQQFVLFLMALSAVGAAIKGVYPDGTEKNGIFIFADQCYAIYLCLGHFAATIRNAKLSIDEL